MAKEDYKLGWDGDHWVVRWEEDERPHVVHLDLGDYTNPGPADHAAREYLGLSTSGVPTPVESEPEEEPLESPTFDRTPPKYEA